MSNDYENDIRRLSQAMDVLARLVLEKKNDNGTLQLEYKKKLDELDKVIGLLLGISKNNTNGDYTIDRNRIDRMLRDGIEIMEKKDPQSNGVKKYALIPIIDSPTQRRKSRKKNKIACSFCHEIGHTRAKCENRLIYTPPKDS